MAEEKIASDSRLPVLFHGEAEKVNALARYGESKAIRIVADRLEATDKSKVPLTRSENLLVAQAAIATGLIPFEPNPELWKWVSIRNGQRFLTIMRGRDGTIRLASEAAQHAGTYIMAPRYRQIIDEQEKAKLGIPKDAMVVEAFVEDKQTNDEYYKRFALLKDAGMNAEQIMEKIGETPNADSGIGILTMQEMKQLEKAPGGNRFPHINRVRKRAYIEALKARWAPNINYAALTEGRSSDTEDYIIEGEWLEVEIEDNGKSQEEKESQGAKASEHLFGEDKEKPDRKSPAFWPKKVIEEIVAKNYAENEFEAAGMLSYSTFEGNVAKTPALLFARAYRGARDADEEPKRAGEIGMAAYLKTLKRGKDK